MREIAPEPISQDAFAEFGDVIDTAGQPDRIINEGMCDRYHDRARLDFAGGRAGVSLFDAKPRNLPYDFTLVERHPDGSQCFIPMAMTGFLVIVAPNEGGHPGTPKAFLTAPGQAINLHRGTWHGVLTPLSDPGLFAVIDRIGPGANLEEYRYAEPWRVTAPE